MPAIEASYLSQLFAKIFRGFEFKIVTGIFISTLSFLYDSVYKEAMLAIIILTIFDLITRIAAEKKLGNPIRSQKVFRSPVKLLVYFLMISAARLTETATHNVLPIIDETIMGFLAATEFVSILENIGHMGYAVPQKLLNQIIKFKDKQ